MATPSRHLYAAPVLLLALGLGCDCAHRAQFHVRQSDDVLADTSDRSRVGEVVASAATGAGLENYTRDSVEPGTIVFFREPLPRENPRTLHVGARSAGGLIVVDVRQWDPGCEAPRKAKFNRLMKSLNTGLTEAFPGRVTMTKDASKMLESGRADATPEGS